jgi:hypothetical protein
MDVNVLPEQVATPQTVPLDWFEHIPLPSHLPVWPQGGCAGHMLWGSLAPGATLAQLPALLPTLQD